MQELKEGDGSRQPAISAMQRFLRLLQRKEAPPHNLCDDSKEYGSLVRPDSPDVDSSGHSKLSRASTATGEAQDVVTLHTPWASASEPASLLLAHGAPHDFGDDGWQLPVLLDLPSGEVKLCLASTCGKPAPERNVLYLGVSRKLQYRPFCADFGPFNLGMR